MNRFPNSLLPLSIKMKRIKRLSAIIWLTAVAIMCATTTTGHSANEYDVVVYGGTPGGITAAIAAARDGASVILLEQTRHVGGLTTSGLNRDECNHLDRQTLGGLCEQFLEEAVKRSNGRWTEGSSRTWQSGIAEQVFLEMLEEAGRGAIPAAAG
jgi:choline dehydrogenase-like flavoprotein